MANNKTNKAKQTAAGGCNNKQKRQPSAQHSSGPAKKNATKKSNVTSPDQGSSDKTSMHKATKSSHQKMSFPSAASIKKISNTTTSVASVQISKIALTTPPQTMMTTMTRTSTSYAQTVGYGHGRPQQKTTETSTGEQNRHQDDHKDDPIGHKTNTFAKIKDDLPSTSASASAPCAKCTRQSASPTTPTTMTYSLIGPLLFTGKHFCKPKSFDINHGEASSLSSDCKTHQQQQQHQTTKSTSYYHHHSYSYHRTAADRNFDRNFVARNSGFVPIVQPEKPVLSTSNIAAVIADADKLIIIDRLGKRRTSYPIMQCGTLEAPDSSYHIQRSTRMDVFQIDDGFHSDGGTETPPPSPSSGSSIASTSDHGSLESVDTGGAQRLAVLSCEQVRKLHDVMDETVAIHGRGNFPTLEVKLKDLVNLVRRKLEADVVSGGAGVIVKDIRLNGGAASHVLASEDQPYNDLDLIYAIEFSSSRHFDRVKTAVLNTLLDLLPEGVSKRRIMPCALKEAYVGKMVKVNNNNDGDRWSLISLGNSPGHKNVELKFVDTMRRQFEFSVDSFQIVLDSLLLFYDCAALPISENFYPTVVGESVYGDFQEALYHLQKKLISTRQPEEIRGGGLLKYCNLLVRNYKPVDSQRIKTLERYMCSRFFIDFPDINMQTVKLEAYLRNHFWGIDEEPLQYQYLMHLREVVETSTVCLMGHERRQTLLLIQSLAMQVLCREQQKQQHTQAQEQYQQQQADMQAQQQQMLVQQQTQQQQSQNQTTATICCQMPAPGSQDGQQQQQQQTVSSASAAAQQTIPQTIQIQAGPPGLIYANGVYYAPVIPATICTCNSTWLST